MSDQALTTIWVVALGLAAVLLAFVITEWSDTPQDCREMCAPRPVASFEPSSTPGRTAACKCGGAP